MSTLTGSSGGRLDGTHLAANRASRALHCVEVTDWRITEKVYFPDRAMSPHSHDVSNVTFFLAGEMEESSGRTREIGRSGAWVTKPAGVTHANRVGRHGARVLEVVFTGEGPPRGFAYGWRRGGPEAVTFLRIYRELRRKHEDGPQVISELCLALPSGRCEERADAPAWIRGVRDRLHDHAGRIPSLSALAREFDVHPTYLARAYRKRFGCSIGEYARRLRVEHAARLIARREPESLAGIALDTGFADQCHLTRTFRACTGLTPGAYRALIRD